MIRLLESVAGPLFSVGIALLICSLVFFPSSPGIGQTYSTGQNCVNLQMTLCESQLCPSPSKCLLFGSCPCYVYVSPN